MPHRRPSKIELVGAFDEMDAIRKVIPHLSIREILNITLSSKGIPRMLDKPDPSSYGYSVEQYENDIVRRPLEKSKLIKRSFFIPIILSLVAALIALVGPFIFPDFRPSPFAWAVVVLGFAGPLAPIYFNVAWTRMEKGKFANYHRHERELIGYVRSSRWKGVI